MLRIVLTAGIAAAIMGGAAEAAPKCSPGKIYRVSKKVCVDKTSAVRQGIISARQSRAKSSADAKAAAAARRAAVRQVSAKQQRSRQAREAAPEVRERVTGSVRERAESETPTLRPAISPPPSRAVGSTTSPFGALLNPWSSDVFTLLPETRFSLKMAGED